MNSQFLGKSGSIGAKRVWAYGLIAAAAIAALAYANVRAADPPAGAGAKVPPVTLEALAGGVKRVTLTPKAAERLGIATDKVSEQTVIRRQMLGGLAVAPVDSKQMQPGGANGKTFGGAPQAGSKSAAAQPGSAKPAGAGFGAFGGFGGGAAAQPALKTIAAPMAATPPMPPAAAGDVWIQVSMSPAEWERTVKDKPARLIALGTRAALGELLAKPSGLEPVEDPKRSMLSVYYIVSSKDHGLAPNTRMRVELPMLGSEDKQKVVPYSAIYYDGKGTPWVYVTTKPLVYERQRVAVERIAGDLAVLSEGPAVGTTVVSVGASMLFGTEIFGK